MRTDKTSDQRSELDPLVAETVEDNLYSALERLKSRRVRGIPVRITYSGVAREAGLSRTLIGHDECAYPDVRRVIGEAIDAQKERSSAPMVDRRDEDEPDPQSIISELKEEIKRLRKEVQVAMIKIVTIDDENQQLRRLADKQAAELDRLKASQPKSPARAGLQASPL